MPCKSQIPFHHKESWAQKNWCFWTVVLEKTLERPLDCREVQPVHPKGDQSGVFIGRTDVEAETPILWPSDVKSWLIGKDPDSGRDWGQEEKGMTEDEMIGWHHWLNGHGFGWTPGVGDGQGGLVCCGSWGHKELDMTEQLNWMDIVSLKTWDILHYYFFPYEVSKSGVCCILIAHLNSDYPYFSCSLATCNWWSPYWMAQPKLYLL